MWKLMSETLNLVCSSGKVTFYPDLDEEIDFLHSVIEKQEVSEIRQPKKQSKHPGKNPESDLKM